MWRAIGGLKARPSRPTPLISACLISASVQPPMPLAECEVMLETFATPQDIFEFVSALAPRIYIVLRAIGPPRMAFHAVRDGGKIEAALDWIAQFLFAHRLFRTGNELGMARRPIDRRLNLIAYWPDGTNISGHRVEVVRREHLVKGKRHLRRQWNPAGRTPSVNARLKSSVLHLPMPVSVSDEILVPLTRYRGVSQVCDPPEKRFDMSNAPPGGRGVWQPSQAMTALTR